MKKLRKKILIVVGAILIFLTLGFCRALTNPHANLTMLGAGVDIGSGFIRYTKDFYVLVLVTEDIEEFEGTKYVIIFRDEDGTKVDLIKGEGIENVQALAGEEATDYLEGMDFDVDAFDREWLDNHHK